MKVPHTQKRKALVIIDVQDAFLRPHNGYIVDNILKLIDKEPYDLYVDAVFFAAPGSLWHKQQNWSMPDDSAVQTVQSIDEKLQDKNRLTITKSSRSVFKGTPSLIEALQANDIAELHVCGIATHDCVLATAFEAFDLGYPVYAIEECCQSSTPGRHDYGITLLRFQHMSNNSCLARTKEL